jgi:UDP-glucuronate 4-epimerase
MDFIKAIEAASGKVARIKFRPMQPGDVVGTAANITKLNAINGFEPKTDINTGVQNFVNWFKAYYKV